MDFRRLSAVERRLNFLVPAAKAVAQRLELVAGRFVHQIFHRPNSPPGLLGLPAGRSAAPSGVEHGEKMLWRHRKRTHAEAEVSNAAVSADDDHGLAVLSIVDPAFDHGVGAEVRRRIYDFDIRAPGVRPDAFGLYSLAVEKDTRAVARSRAPAAGRFDERFTCGLEILAGERAKGRIAVEHVVTVDIIPFGHNPIQLM